MKTQLFRNVLLFLFLIVFCTSCATPIAPTGGPADNTAPIVEFTEPQTGTTNFSGTEFRIQFNEYINRNSVPAAITIEPDLGVDYDLSWKRRTLIISFQDNLSDSTTVIVKLGGAISDVNGNRMDKTTSIAVSTGDEIDSGRISGKILLAENGRGAARQKILLYRSPVDFTQKANYETSTDTSGSFTFSYLGEGNYQAALVDDRNRNKIWDRPTESAQPFYKRMIELEKAGSDSLQAIYTTVTDSLQPKILGVGLFSTQRIRLRFSEPITISEAVNIAIQDSSGNEYSEAYPLYISPKDDFVLFAQSEEPLLENESYLLNLNGITDLAGNPVDTSGIPFTGSSQSDTTLQRIISSNADRNLLQDDAFVATYAAPVSDPEIIDSLVVIEGTIDFQDWPEVETRRNQLIISPQGEWVEDTEYQFLLWNPVTQRRKMFEPQIWDSTEYGDVEINLENTDSAATHYVRLLNKAGFEVAFEMFKSSIVITDLPPVSYTLIVYKDEDENKTWDRGKVIPYEAPEPYYVQQNIRVQEGFTSEVKITF